MPSSRPDGPEAKRQYSSKIVPRPLVAMDAVFFGGNMLRFKTVVFDLDGTLFDTAPGIF